MEETDHYGLLEIPRSATTADIERAYRLSQQTYGKGSLALYSIFESGEAEAIQERLDEAYRVLSDPESRAAYDAERPLSEAPATLRPWLDTRGHEASPAALPNEVPTSSPDEGVEPYDAFEDEDGGDFDGVRLRRARLFRGYEIDEIANVTKVSGTHLRNIEDENFVDLPADVYVRGFVAAYATTIGLDPKIVVPSYMARVKESRSGNRQGRLLARS